MTSEECRDIAKDMATELIDLTDGPQDAAEILIYLHIIIWKSQEGKASTSTMLDCYKASFLEMLGEGATLQ